MEWPISFEKILAARERLRPYLVPTALRNYASLDEVLGARVWVKHENHQPTNSFKVRNGLAAMTALSEAEKKRGVIAATRGNHGLGVAYAGKQLGVRVTICVPRGNNVEKNEGMRGLGAEVIEEGQNYDESLGVMERIARERGMLPIHSTNNREVMAGAGTMSLEILEQAEAMGEKLDAIVVAVGGGSQAVGAMTIMRKLRPEMKVYAVQSLAASATHDSWKARSVVAKAAGATIADGVATGTPYEMSFGALREGLADFVLVSEEEIARAICLVISKTHNLVEGAGAVGVAGLGRIPALKGKIVAVVLSGANIDQATLRNVFKPGDTTRN
jgi:threonine dehydratase